MKLHQFIVEVYEADKPYPAIAYVFMGESKEEALERFQAHAATTPYLKDMIEKGAHTALVIAGGTVRGRVMHGWTEEDFEPHEDDDSPLELVSVSIIG